MTSVGHTSLSGPNSNLYPRTVSVTPRVAREPTHPARHSRDVNFARVRLPSVSVSFSLSVCREIALASAIFKTVKCYTVGVIQLISGIKKTGFQNTQVL